MSQPTPASQVLATSSFRDEDSAIHLERLLEDDGTVSVELWGTEDVSPEAPLAVTCISEPEFVAWLARAGYTVTRTEAAQ